MSAPRDAVPKTGLPSGHTPSPWDVKAEKLDGVVRLIGPAGEEFHYVAQTVHGNDEANAEFIVRACNAHERLVEALEESLAWLVDFRPDLLLMTRRSLDESIGRTRAALQSARGEEAANG